MNNQKPTIVELTDKKWKILSLKGGGIFLVGFVLMLVGFGLESKAGFVIGTAIMFGGLGVSLYARFKAWWHHG